MKQPEPHEHKLDRLRVGPPKVFLCAVEGCTYEVPVKKDPPKPAPVEPYETYPEPPGVPQPHE